MAYETGTATDADDLFAKIQSFLKTNVDLVAATQEWTEAWNGTSVGEPDDIVLRGPGLASADDVYIGLSLFKDATNDLYDIRMTGMTGILGSGATSYRDHIGTSPAPVKICIFDSAMEYWIVANGRRFVLIVKVSTVYEALYGGLILPYATPVSYPYPLMIGGSGAVDGVGGGQPDKWSSVVENHRHFTGPYKFSDTSPTVFAEPSAWILDPGVAWRSIGNQYDSLHNPYGDLVMGPHFSYGTIANPGDDGGTTSVYPAKNVHDVMKPTWGDDYPLFQHTVMDLSQQNTIGILDGTFSTVAFANSAESIITVGGVDHLVVQNVFRAGGLDFWALKLE